jgi:deoxyribodipyrimidine photo-lyase
LTDRPIECALPATRAGTTAGLRLRIQASRHGESSNVTTVPSLRVRTANDRPVASRGRWILYWMTAQRRRRANFGLQRAVELARELDRPVVVLEALRCGYRWASDRLHAFVLQGMAQNRADFAGTAVCYHPYVEPEPGAGKGLLEALAAAACAVVTDEYPCFFLPRMVAAAAARLPVRCEVVDGNGLLPLRAADKVFARAVDFRRFLQRELPPHLAWFPVGDPLRASLPAAVELPAAITRRWPAASDDLLAAGPAALRALPIDHSVAPSPIEGGPRAAGATLRAFLGRLPRYVDERSDPDADVPSGLSPYLHFGHIGAHQVFAALAQQEGWQRTKLRPGASGQRGWFGMSAPAEAFLDQLVTWRELGFNFCSQRVDYDRYESLPAWARATLAEHAGDARTHLYSLAELAMAATHDPLWNAAQRQLVREGRMHNYLRMLWGKKVIEWSPSPRQALEVLIELNNRYALDGRDPNSYSGIFWTFGRYDRPWAPKREVFGVVRWMSSRNTLRKVRAVQYLARYAE